MQEILMTVTSKGQVTIPASLRRHLNIRKNQKIALVLEADGSVRLRLPTYTTVASLRGAAGSMGRNLTWDQMRAIAYEDRGLQSRKTK
jgi:AbrB family looped-hinge helix DNA binding protein